MLGGRKDARGSALRIILYSTSQRNCFTNKNRLPDAAAYRRAFMSGHNGISGDFKWFAITNDIDTARLGTTVPKRHVRKAVYRNRLKRQIRESFRVNQRQLRGLDVVVVVRRQVTTTGHSLKLNLEKIWSRVSGQFDHNV